MSLVGSLKKGGRQDTEDASDPPHKKKPSVLDMASDLKEKRGLQMLLSFGPNYTLLRGGSILTHLANGSCKPQFIRLSRYHDSFSSLCVAWGLASLPLLLRR
jgi:hypothetical protein